MIDVFKVGVHIAMTSNGPAVLGLLLRDLGKVHASTSAINRNLKLVGGALAALGGFAVLKGLWSVVEASRDLNKELERTKQLGGVFAAQLGETRAAAFTANRAVPTIAASEAVRLQREVGTTLGHPDAARAMLEAAAKTAFVVSHFTGEDQEAITKNLMRTADARAAIFAMKDGQEVVDPTKLLTEMDAAGRSLILAGGFLHSNDLLQRARQAGQAAKMQTPEAFYAAGAESAIMMGASKTGTAETGLLQQFIGGTMTKKVAEHLTEAGFLRPGEWHSGKSGGVVVDPQVAARFTDLMADPQKYFAQGEGATKVKGYADAQGISPLMAVFQLFGRQTVQRLIGDFMSNSPQYARAREIMGGIPGVEQQYAELRKNDLDTNVIALTKAWKSFMEALGDAGVPLAITVLTKLTDAVHVMTRAAADNPQAAEWLIGIAAGMGALAAIGGTIVVVSTALAPIAAGLSAIAGIAGLATLGATMTAIGSGLATIVAPIAALAGVLRLGSDNETQENRDRLEQLRRQRGGGLGPSTLQPQDGFGPDGAPLHRSSFVAPPRAVNGHAPIENIIYLDGHRLTEIVTNRQANLLSRPPAGTTGIDTRVSPTYPLQLQRA